jgi:hypothetical protein
LTNFSNSKQTQENLKNNFFKTTFKKETHQSEKTELDGKSEKWMKLVII